MDKFHLPTYRGTLKSHHHAHVLLLVQVSGTLNHFVVHLACFVYLGPLEVVGNELFLLGVAPGLLLCYARLPDGKIYA